MGIEQRGAQTDAAPSVQTLDEAEAYAALHTAVTGLTEAEASARLKRYGPNSLPEPPSQSLALKFLANFTHLMAILLWAGGIAGFAAGMPQLGVAIWMVNVINGAFSFWQEYKAEKATEALRRLLPVHARVVRDGREHAIPAEALVPGDVILLAEGDRVSADARLIEAAGLRVDQSTLTGESEPVTKTAQPSGPGEGSEGASNLVFAGTAVAAGSGTGIVFATGRHTRFGNIAYLTQAVSEEPSPLQKEMRRVTRTVTLLATGSGLIFFLLATSLVRVSLAEAFVFAMGMIVAFVPEGMLPTVTLSLAMGVQRMARRHALVKKLSAVETLGSATVICTDKTGVLTENEMTVVQLWCGGKRYSVTGVGYQPAGRIFRGSQPLELPLPDALARMLTAASLCNDARVLSPDPEHEQWWALGDPTEAALQVAALKAGLDLDSEHREWPSIGKLPFDSVRKRMSTLHQRGPSRVAFVKGAPRELLALSGSVRLDGQVLKLDEARRAEIIQANDEYARSGLRVLAVAERHVPDDLMDYRPGSIEQDLTFLGLMAMLDPPRPEVPGAVRKCRGAGIRIIMITGDYGLTAVSIARRSSIAQGRHVRVLTGKDLDGLDEPELRQALKRDVIFARVAPEHKLRIVEALQREGEVVAVTGDGVNDAPALRRADIGIAMGMTGTDVAKEAADMILTDDNFASIINAIEEGRTVYSNIRKFATYVFNSNMAEAVPFVAMLFSRGAIPLPLTVMQVLSIDLGTDMVPAIGLGAEPPEPGIMHRPPRSRTERLLDAPLLTRALLWYGLLESFAGMSAYFFLNWLHGWPAAPLAPLGSELYRAATTMTLAGVVAGQVGAVFGCRTARDSIFKRGLTTNRLVLIGIAIELTLLGLLAYVPIFHGVLNTAALRPLEWAFVLAWAPIIFLLDEARKALLRRRAWSTARSGPARLALRD